MTYRSVPPTPAHPELSLIKKTADVDDNRYLRPDGSNLAAFLYYLREKHETSYSLIRHTVQRVAPFFDDFLLEPQKLNPNKIRLEWRHKGSEVYFDASSLSDGTLRFIALATLFFQPEEYRPSIILVDEPELGLHPYAITMLASLVKQASVKTQVILSPQSPQFLDHFQPEDVLVTDRVDGGTQFTRLDSVRLASWPEDYSLGQPKLETAAWGEGVVEALARYIQRRHPNLRGFTRRNLFRMRQFYEAYRGHEVVSALLARLPWTHHLMILSRSKRPEEREFYIRLATHEKWSSRDCDSESRNCVPYHQ